jgi:hypothetical protein
MVTDVQLSAVSTVSAVPSLSASEYTPATYEQATVGTADDVQLSSMAQASPAAFDMPAT